MPFVCLPNVTSPSQAEAYGLALSRASGNIEPYTALKNFVLSSVSVECNTDWIDVSSKIECKRDRKTFHFNVVYH